MSREIAIFDSERSFVLFLANLMLFVGGFPLAWVLLCRISGASICEGTFVPVFGGIEFIRKELALFNLPLALIILGIGLRVFSVFGWLTCIALGAVLLFSFSYLFYLMNNSLPIFMEQATQNGFSLSGHPIVESMYINAILALISFFFLLYLSLPGTRYLYFQSQKSN